METRFSTRRELLRASGTGFGWLAFQGLFANSASNPLAPHGSHFPAKAKRVIFLFMCGGPSQVDTFDYKPGLSKQHQNPLITSVAHA